MKVRIVARTHMSSEEAFAASGDRWVSEDSTASDLAEFAGRVCYESWDRPNPKTATTMGYIGNIINQQHFSVLEHGTVSVHVSDVSRSLTHELVRHRHFSYSQLSQRFVVVNAGEPETDDVPYVVPPLFEGDRDAGAILSAAWSYATHAYERLMDIGMAKIGDDQAGRPTRTKRVKEAARAVLPNMTPTAIVVTGNHRAWREFFVKRGSLAADAEIRRMAVATIRLLDMETPELYQDFEIHNHAVYGDYLVGGE